MNLKRLKDSGLLMEPTAQAPSGGDGESVVKRSAILVHQGDFMSADGAISFDEERLRRVVQNHNAMIVKLQQEYGGADKMPVGAYPPLLDSHEDGSNDKVIGRLNCLLEFAVRDIPGVGKQIPCVVAKEITFLGKMACEKVNDGRIYHLSVGIDESTDTLGELSAVITPAAPGAMLLKKGLAAGDPKQVGDEILRSAGVNGYVKVTPIKQGGFLVTITSPDKEGMAKAFESAKRMPGINQPRLDRRDNVMALSFFYGHKGLQGSRNPVEIAKDDIDAKTNREDNKPMKKMAKWKVTVKDMNPPAVGGGKEFSGEFDGNTENDATREAKDFYATELDTEPKFIKIVKITKLSKMAGSDNNNKFMLVENFEGFSIYVGASGFGEYGFIVTKDGKKVQSKDKLNSRADAVREAKNWIRGEKASLSRMAMNDGPLTGKTFKLDGVTCKVREPEGDRYWVRAVDGQVVVGGTTYQKGEEFTLPARTLKDKYKLSKGDNMNLKRLKKIHEAAKECVKRSEDLQKRLRADSSKTYVVSRLTHLMRGGKMTPAEFKSADLKKLSALDRKSLDVCLDMYEKRENVIQPGQRGSSAAPDFSRLAEGIKGKEISRLRKEVATDFIKSGAKLRKMSAFTGEGDEKEKELEEGSFESKIDKKMAADKELADKEEDEEGKKLSSHLESMKSRMAEAREHLANGRTDEAAKCLESMETDHEAKLSDISDVKKMKRLANGLGFDGDDKSAEQTSKMQEQIDMLQTNLAKLSEQVGSIIKAEESEEDGEETQLEEGEGVADEDKTRLEDDKETPPANLEDGEKDEDKKLEGADDKDDKSLADGEKDNKDKADDGNEPPAANK